MYVCMYVMYSKMINRRFLRDILHSIFSFFCLFFQTETTTATLVARSAANVHPELDWASEDGVVGTTSAWNASQHLKLEGHITYSPGGVGYMTCKFSISELRAICTGTSGIVVTFVEEQAQVPVNVYDFTVSGKEQFDALHTHYTYTHHTHTIC